MSRFARRQGRRLTILAAVLTIAVAGCGSGSATPAPASAAPSNATSTTATPADTGAGNSAGLAGAATALGNLDSYKFTMSLVGDFGSLLGSLGAAGSANSPTDVSGTITFKPDKAADVTGSDFHIIEVGGFDYMDIGKTGNFSQTAITDSMVDTFAPNMIFANSMVASTLSDFDLVGSQQKNGIQADQYRANDSAVATYGSVLGLTGAQWTTDVWVAHDGGYLLSVDIEAKAADGTTAYQMKFDISNVDDAANKVTAPANVTGA